MPDIDIIKQMPYSLEAEQALLGAIIIDPELLNDALTLRSDDFYVARASGAVGADHAGDRRLCRHHRRAWLHPHGTY